MKKKNLLMTVMAIFGLATISIAQTVPSYIPTSGLVGWWPFNGNANDESGNGNNGNIQGAMAFTSDRYGISSSALIGNGTSSVEIPTPNALPLGNNSRTFSLYFKVNDVSTLSSNRELLAYGFNSPGQRFGLIMINNQIGIEYAIPANLTNWTPDTQWHHLVVSYDQTLDTIKLYLDNNIIINTSPAVAIGTTSCCTFFGSLFGPINSYLYSFDGNIDDIGIWDRALTQQEITDLFNGCQLSVNTQPSSQTININNNVQFVVSSSDPSATYQWQTDLGVGFQNLNNVGQYSGTANDTLTIANTTLSNNNQPFRCIISSGSCTDTSNVAVLTVNNNVGINEFTQNNLFSVYPNPAKSQINVKAGATLLGSVYTVYDNIGKVVLSGKINSENTVIELGNLSGGIYLFTVGENMKQTFRVIKE
jgi:hypothetical protein